ncbi:MAG TPA: TadE/TadG family type IV pilus assembly protein, partial [Anaerolineales bacterium]
MNRFFRTTQRRSAKPRAQAIVEFALVLPLLLLVVIGILEFSRLLFAWIILENSTRFGIRYATTGIYNADYCPGGVCSTEDEVDAARIPSIKDETTRMVLGFFKRDARFDPSVTNAEDTYFNVTVCSEARDFT